MSIEIPALSFTAILPELIMLGTALLVLLLDLVLKGKRPLAYLSLAGVVAAGAASYATWGRDPHPFQEMLLSDSYALFINLVICLAAALSLLVAANYLERHDLQRGEYYALLLFSAFGMMLMGAANDLIVVFLALETLSISLYVLVGLNRAAPASGEAALKYFLLGALASGFFLYGVALAYGATGTTGLEKIGDFIIGKMGEETPSLPADPVLMTGLALMLIGFSFKLALVPFHFWAPDVYQGAPTSITAFMAVGVKAAVFAALGRTLHFAFSAFYLDWTPVLAVVSVLTMTWGNVAALTQRDVKRMLAYSSVAHAGYILVGLAAGSVSGLRGILFYLVVYALATVGAFAVVAALEPEGATGVDISAFRGLAARRPLLALSMTIFMLSLMGLPPLAGFWGKLYVFRAAVEGRMYWLAALGVLNSALSAFYYLGVVISAYMGEPESAPPAPGRALDTAIILAALFTVLVGLWPTPLTLLALAGV
jgi:NADH-quinone oxidoreductase subunit N